MDGIEKILVTGSSGTIGTRLCEKLLENNYSVVGVDWKNNKWNDEVDDLTIKLDLRDKNDVLRKLPNDIDMIIHLAANARVYNLVVDPSMARDNFETIFNTLEYARQNKVKKFIFSSSRETYGNSDKIIHTENEAHIDMCESPYTASKLGGEALVRAYEKCYDMDFVIFRFSNVYGMYDESDRVIPLFIKLSINDEDLIIYGRDKLLDFTYIDDTINGVLQSIKNFNIIKNQTYNLAYGVGTSITEVAEQIIDLTGSKGNIIFQSNRTGEVVKYIADISKAKKSIGYNPMTIISEGVKKSVNWYLSNIYNNNKILQ